MMKRFLKMTEVNQYLQTAWFTIVLHLVQSPSVEVEHQTDLIVLLHLHWSNYWKCLNGANDKSSSDPKFLIGFIVFKTRTCSSHLTNIPRETLERNMFTCADTLTNHKPYCHPEKGQSTLPQQRAPLELICQCLHHLFLEILKGSLEKNGMPTSVSCPSSLFLQGTPWFSKCLHGV